MLSHANIMSQLRHFDTLINVHAGDTTLSLLPPWHIYERTTGYFIFQQGTTQVHSAIHDTTHCRFFSSTHTRTCFIASAGTGTCQSIMLTHLRSNWLQVYSNIKKFRCASHPLIQSTALRLTFAALSTATHGTAWSSTSGPMMTAALQG